MPYNPNCLQKDTCPPPTLITFIKTLILPWLHSIDPIQPWLPCFKHNTMGHWHHDWVRCMLLHTSNPIKPGKWKDGYFHCHQTLVATTHVAFGPNCTLLKQLYPNCYAINTMQRGTGIMIVLDVCCTVVKQLNLWIQGQPQQQGTLASWLHNI